MTEHLPTQLILRYRSRTLLAGERHIIHQHLGECEQCLRHLVTLKDLAETVEAFRNIHRKAGEETIVDHPAVAKLREYALNALRPVENSIVEGHLELCPPCLQLMEDLSSRDQFFVNQWRIDKLINLGKFYGQIPDRLSNSRMLVAATLLLFFITILVVHKYHERPIDQTQLSLPMSANTNSAIKAIATTQPNDQQTGAKGAGQISSYRSPGTRQSISNKQPNPQLNNRAQRAYVNRHQSRSSCDNAELVGIEHLPVALQNQLIASRRTGQVPRSSELMGLTGHAGVQLKGLTDDALYETVSPANTVILSDRPTLQWRPIPKIPLADVSAFFVTITDLDTGLRERSGPLTTTYWTPAEPLAPNHRYRWSVVARLISGEETEAPFPPAPEARFKVIAPNRAAMLRRFISQSKGATSPYVRGMLYAQEGLIEDAETEFKRLVELNPHSKIAKRLLQNVKSLRTHD